MYFHGGGWVLGNAATYDRFIRELAHGTAAAVVFVEYRRSPEERFPVPLEECYAATAWVAEHGAQLGVDGSRIAVAGDSAGGNMATVVSRLALERRGPKIASQVLIYPATAAGFDMPSIREFAEDHYLTLEASRWFWHQYAPDRAADSDPNACPLLAPAEQLRAMPPALIITAECDILRDEGEAYARKLSQAGVPVTCTRYLGAIHGFMGINALADTPANRAAQEQVFAAVRKSLFSRAC
jgi:acetyl esterase